MANVKISALPAATLPLSGTEELPLVQSTSTKKVFSGTFVLSVNGNTPDPQGNVVVSGGGGPQVATVSISSAQLLTISTSPITIVAAQGANKVIVPMQVIYNYKVVTTGYSGSSLVMQLGSPPVSIGGGFAAYLASTPVVTSQSANITNANSTNLVNTDLILTSFSNPTGGDSTLEVTVIYNVITV